MGLKKLVQKYSTEYLSHRIVFLIDYVLSFGASFLVWLLLMIFSQSVRAWGVLLLLWWGGASIVATLIGFLIFKPYRIIVRHTSLNDMFIYMMSVFTKILIMGIVFFVIILPNYYPHLCVGLFMDFCITLIFVVLVRVTMTFVYVLIQDKRQNDQMMHIMVYRTYEKSISIVTRLVNSPHYQVVGFLSDAKNEKGLTVNELPIYYYADNDDAVRIMSELNIDAVLYPTAADAQKEQSGLLNVCMQNGIKSLIAPAIDEVVDGQVMKKQIREVKIEDLLGRDEIKISMDEIKANFHGKTVMVTGAAGSIGSELCRQLATFGVERLILFDNAETPIHNIRLELEARFPYLKFVPMIGDVRQTERLDGAFRLYHPQVVFHAAAYKHVPLMEENPCEAVMVNVAGSRNVADKCLEYGVEKMVMISTDKAVNPTNVMGCSKRLAEIYVQSLGLAVERGEVAGRTKFVTTRFGNVLGSNGSVIPRFREQIAKGGPVTVTHPDITRFFMTIPEACRLVMEAATMSTGNQIFVFDMGESVKIDDLAKRMIELAGLKLGKDIDITYTGLRPGEKLYEEVLSNTENTLPTTHERIRIAQVREYDYQTAVDVTTRLKSFAYNIEIPEMVMLMKETVPEYISKNSEFEKYDKK